MPITYISVNRKINFIIKFFLLENYMMPNTSNFEHSFCGIFFFVQAIRQSSRFQVNNHQQLVRLGVATPITWLHKFEYSTKRFKLSKNKLLELSAIVFRLCSVIASTPHDSSIEFENMRLVILSHRSRCPLRV